MVWGFGCLNTLLILYVGQRNCFSLTWRQETPRGERGGERMAGSADGGIA